MLKSPLNVDYFPMQKSLKILPNISSTSTFPTIIPKCRVAKRRSSAALSKSSASFFLQSFSNNLSFVQDVVCAFHE